MLVCHCSVVSDRTIREAVRDGAASIEAVAATCGAATGCGGCHELVESIVRDEQRQCLRPLAPCHRREQEPQAVSVR